MPLSRVNSRISQGSSEVTIDLETQKATLNAIAEESGLSDWTCSPEKLALEQKRNLPEYRSRVFDALVFKDLKVRLAAFELLRRFFELDPVTKTTATCLPEIVGQLSECVEKAEDYTGQEQKALLNTYGSAIETLLAHQFAGHIRGISDATQKRFLESPEFLKKLDRGDDRELRLDINFAIEGVKRVTTPKKSFRLLFLVMRVTKLTAHLAANETESAWKDAKKLFAEARSILLERQKPWYEAVCLIRGVSRMAIYSPDRTMEYIAELTDFIYQQSLVKRGPSNNCAWTVFVGAARAWGYIITHYKRDNKEVCQKALTGFLNIFCFEKVSGAKNYQKVETGVVQIIKRLIKNLELSREEEALFRENVSLIKNCLQTQHLKEQVAEALEERIEGRRLPPAPAWGETQTDQDDLVQPYEGDVEFEDVDLEEGLQEQLQAARGELEDARSTFASRENDLQQRLKSNQAKLCRKQGECSRLQERIEGLEAFKIGFSANENDWKEKIADKEGQIVELRKKVRSLEEDLFHTKKKEEERDSQKSKELAKAKEELFASEKARKELASTEHSLREQLQESVKREEELLWTERGERLLFEKKLEETIAELKMSKANFYMLQNSNREQLTKDKQELFSKESQIKGLQEQLAEKEEECLGLKEVVDNLRYKQPFFEAQLEMKIKEIENLNSSFSGIKDKLTSQITDGFRVIAQQKREICKLQNGVQDLECQVRENHDKIDQLQDECRNLIKKTQKLERKNSQKNQTILQLNGKINQIKKLLKPSELEQSRPSSINVSASPSRLPYEVIQTQETVTTAIIEGESRPMLHCPPRQTDALHRSHLSHSLSATGEKKPSFPNTSSRSRPLSRPPSMPRIEAMFEQTGDQKQRPTLTPPKTSRQEAFAPQGALAPPPPPPGALLGELDT